MKPRRSRQPVILYILHCGNLYGTERMALATLEGLTDYGHRVVLAPLGYEQPSVASAALAMGLESVSFGSRLSLLRSLLPWFLRYRDVDVIATGVSHSMLCHLLGKIFRARVRQLHVAHGGTADSLDRKRALNQLPVLVIAVSDFIRQKLIEVGVQPSGIRVIDNFLSDVQQGGRTSRASYDGHVPTDARRTRVILISRVDPIKRMDLLLELVERHGMDDFDFDVYGAGEDFDQLKRRAAGRANVHFHGFVADLRTPISDADFLLHLCPVEPFGLVVLEAFRANLVAIVPDTGGSAALVEDGVNGLRFAADQIDDLRRVLEHARRMGGRELQAVADAGRASLESRFSTSMGAQHYRAALAMAGAMQTG